MSGKLPRGRPTKLTPDIQDRICAHIRNGLTREHAAQSCGISAFTLRQWLKRGREEPRGIFCDFLAVVKVAESSCLADCLDTIMKAAKKDWKAAAWIAERRDRKTYARPIVDQFGPAKDKHSVVVVTGVDAAAALGQRTEAITTQLPNTVALAPPASTDDTALSSGRKPLAQ